MRSNRERTSNNTQDEVLFQFNFYLLCYDTEINIKRNSVFQNTSLLLINRNKPDTNKTRYDISYTKKHSYIETINRTKRHCNLQHSEQHSLKETCVWQTKSSSYKMWSKEITHLGLIYREPAIHQTEPVEQTRRLTECRLCKAVVTLTAGGLTCMGNVFICFVAFAVEGLINAVRFYEYECKYNVE